MQLAEPLTDGTGGCLSGARVGPNLRQDRYGDHQRKLIDLPTRRVSRVVRKKQEGGKSASARHGSIPMGSPQERCPKKINDTVLAYLMSQCRAQQR